MVAPTIPIELDNKPSGFSTDTNDEMIKSLLTDGYAVVRGVITPEKASEYVDKAHGWLEGLSTYKRSDPSTWRKANLPRHNVGGMYSGYSFGHSQFVWDIRTTPAYVELFEKIWGTNKLTSSFDAGYLGVPLPTEEVDNQNKRWPHTDQSPFRADDITWSVQSLMNLYPNKKDDGGLWVMKGSANLFPDFVKAFDATKRHTMLDHFRYTEEHVKWFEERGGEIIHPDLGPGDVVLWLSSCMHWGAAPSSGNPRFAVYSCMKPDDQLSDAQRAKKVEAFENGYSTTHDPISFSFKGDHRRDDDSAVCFPYGKPVLSERGLQLAGVKRY